MGDKSARELKYLYAVPVYVYKPTFFGFQWDAREK